MSASSVTSKRRRPRKRSDLGPALLFLAPLLVVYAVYYAYSAFFLVQTSFTKVGIALFGAVDVGWRNFEVLAQDPTFTRSILNTVIFGLVSIISALTIGFFIAIALASGIRARRLFYLVFLLPALIPVSLVATVFGSMFQSRFGIVNEILRNLGVEHPPAWLLSEGLAFGIVAILFAYVIGLPIMYYTADLSALPTESLEAALLDGAGTFRIMREIIYPMMRSTHITVILSLLLGSFRALELSLFSTGGGPNHATEIVGSYLYTYTNSGGPTIGYAAAASIVVLLIAFVISIVQLIVTRRQERLR